MEALSIRKSNDDLRGQLASYTHLGEFYSTTNEKRAEAYFDTVIQISKNIRAPKAEQDVLKKLLDFSNNNLKIYDRYIVLQDSLYEQELKVKTQFAKYKYDDKSKQESIVRLEKENALKELELVINKIIDVCYYYFLLMLLTSIIAISILFTYSMY